MESKNKTMVNWTVCLLLILTAPGISKAQTWGEWFNQKSTQKKYLLKQIAALELYSGYLRQGYDIANSGLNTIKGFTNGEFNLHNAFISSLKVVNPGIKNNVKVADIIACQILINRTFNLVRNHDLLSGADLLYIQRVRQGVIDECNKDLEELLLVITTGKIEMSDEQRIKRLDKVYESMLDKSAFTQNFINDVKLLIKQKESDLQSLDFLRRNYEIN